MGNFEKLSVLVIVVIIVMILVVALYTWTDNPDQTSGGTNTVAVANEPPPQPPLPGAGMGSEKNGVVISPTLSTSGPKDKSGTVDGPKGLSKLLEDANLVGTPKPTDVLPVVPPPAPTAAAPRTYTVKAGDTLSGIAKAEYPKFAKQGLQAILQANPKAGEMLRVKDVLILPELAADGLASNLTPASGPAAPPVTPRPSSTIAKGGVYVVKKGDTLASISRNAFGGPDRWSDIWLTNFDVIDDVDHPSPGTRLKIPR